MPAIEVPESLSDGKLALRVLGSQDAQPYCQAFQEDPGLGATLGMGSDPDEASFERQVAQADGLRASGREIEFAIVGANSESDALVGAVVLHSFQWHHGRAEIGAWVAATSRRSGLALRALTLTVDWAFDALELVRLETTTTPDNMPAQSLARRLGFQREGVMRQRNLERGERVDLMIFGLLRDDWARVATRRARFASPLLPRG
jgi:RimJ/RimL family protein N-acetyltransferase